MLMDRFFFVCVCVEQSYNLFKQNSIIAHFRNFAITNSVARDILTAKSLHFINHFTVQLSKGREPSKTPETFC